MKKESNLLFDLATKVQPHFRSFYLAGGTALMFKYSHRASVDLDFFNQKSFSYSRMYSTVRKHFKVDSEERLDDNIDFVIGGVKVSFVFFPFQNIKAVERIGGIRIASDYDIFLNKLYAAGRRVDPKDPFDAAFLFRMHRWNIPEIKKDFIKKFPDQSFEIYLGALLHFEDYPKLPSWVKSTLLRIQE